MKVLLSFVFALIAAAAAQTCPDDFVLVGEQCLHFEPQGNYTFDEARTYCQSLGGDLAKIADCSVLGIITEYIEANDDLAVEEGYFVGATDFDEEGSFVWFDGTPVKMGTPLWATGPVGDPEPQDDDDLCVFMAAGEAFYFHNTNCDLVQGHSPLCQRQAFGGACISPYIPIGGSCFSFMDTTDASWQDARDLCVQDGADLAVLDDCDLMGQVVEFIYDSGVAPVAGYWIGGYKDDSTWTWVDESPMALGTPFWGKSGDFVSFQQPNGGTLENCIDIWSKERYHFDDTICDNYLQALCEAAPVLAQ